MNIKTTTLILSTIALSAAVQPARAEGARFDFAPNTWAAESPNHPRTWTTMPKAPISQGHVPHNLLGFDPSMMRKPAPPPVVAPRIAPVVQPSVHSQVSFGNPVPQLVPQSVPAAFKAAFGAPLEVPPPATPKQPQPATAPIAPAAKSIAAHPSRPVVASNNLHGRMMRPHLAAGNAAGPAQSLPIASYGKNVGYMPGTYLPSVATGSGSSSTTSLNGRILSRQH